MCMYIVASNTCTSIFFLFIIDNVIEWMQTFVVYSKKRNKFTFQKANNCNNGNMN